MDLLKIVEIIKQLRLLIFWHNENKIDYGNSSSTIQSVNKL